jgi:tight adherence protein C
MLILYAIAGLIFVGVAIPIVGMYLESRSVAVKQRMERIRRPRIAPGSPIERELQRSLWDRVIQPAIKSVGQGMMKTTPGGAVDQARKKLETAGNPASLDVATFMVLKAISLSAGVLGAVAVVTLWQSDAKMLVYAAAGIAFFIGMTLPDSILDSTIKQRQYQITKALPDTIDLLVVSAEAGTGLDGALAQVVRRKPGPLADEFNRVLTEIRLGKRRREAWQDMAERSAVEDLQTLVAALHQAEELGVSIANALRAQSDSLRVRRSMRIRAAAATLSTKMLFPLIFCIFPALFVVVLGPGLMSIDKAFTGLGW